MDTEKDRLERLRILDAELKREGIDTEDAMKNAITKKRMRDRGIDVDKIMKEEIQKQMKEAGLTASADESSEQKTKPLRVGSYNPVTGTWEDM
jgi:hypothetical protein